MLLKCRHAWVSLRRDEFLREPLELIMVGGSWDGTWVTLTDDGVEVDERAHELAIGFALIGGWDHVRDDRIPSWSLGFGQLDVTPDRLDSFGSTFVAGFLQKVVPLYMDALGQRVYSKGGGKVVHRSPTPDVNMAETEEEGTEIF
jgi:hypothetical protein